MSRNRGVPLRALDSATRQRLVSWPHLWECLEAHSRQGQPGLATFRALLELRSGKEPPHGEFVRLLHDLLLDAGLPEPVCEHWVVVGGRRYRLDLAYPELRLGMECDSKEWHLNERAHETDPVRDNALVLGGWRVLHFTWRRMRDDHQGIVRGVQQARG